MYYFVLQEEEDVDPGKDAEFAERAIDAAYEKKLTELERFQKQVERRARENR
eukprot:m.42520 g.42520  ORF g.42520 m.42520 type:complete len:52 (+) comp10523_c1_seq3:1022-1177(+)